MHINVRSLPTELQHANLCRLHPSLMDKCGLGPGDLVLLRDIYYKKNCFARVWLRCPEIDLKWAEENTVPEIEIDPDLMGYLEIGEGDIAILETDFSENQLNIISFQTTSSLPKLLKNELTQIIKHARWPVYPGAFFAVNISGKPIDLMVTSNFSLPAVITPSTTISISNQTDSQENKLRNDILAAETDLSKLQKDIEFDELEKKMRDREIQCLEEEKKEYANKVQSLCNERDKIIQDINSIPKEVQELKETISSLDIEIKNLSAEMARLEDVDIENFDIPAQEQKCKKLQKEIAQSLSDFEKKGKNVF
jgi:hypothetical protein